jgi:hypothetical protein
MKRSRHQIIISSTGLAIAIVILVSGCGSGSTLTVNKPMKSGDATVEVTKITAAKAIKSESGELAKPEPGQVFLLITYDIQNTSNKPIVMIDPWITKNPKGKLFTEALSETSFYEKKYEITLNGTSPDDVEALQPGAKRNDILAIYIVTPPYKAHRKAGQALEESASTVQEIFPGNPCYFVVADRSFSGQSAELVVQKFYSYSQQTGTRYAISPFPAATSYLTIQDIKNRSW